MSADLRVLKDKRDNGDSVFILSTKGMNPGDMFLWREGNRSPDVIENIEGVLNTALNL